MALAPVVMGVVYGAIPAATIIGGLVAGFVGHKRDGESIDQAVMHINTTDHYGHEFVNKLSEYPVSNLHQEGIILILSPSHPCICLDTNSRHRRCL
jgi:hypothetical protein